VREAAGCLSDPALGWAYVDQRQLCKPLHDLVELRSLMVKRPAITTVGRACSIPVREGEDTSGHRLCA
jgi:hypothetical protein